MLKQCLLRSFFELLSSLLDIVELLVNKAMEFLVVLNDLPRSVKGVLEA